MFQLPTQNHSQKSLSLRLLRTSHHHRYSFPKSLAPASPRLSAKYLGPHATIFSSSCTSPCLARVHHSTPQLNSQQLIATPSILLQLIFPPSLTRKHNSSVLKSLTAKLLHHGTPSSSYTVIAPQLTSLQHSPSSAVFNYCLTSKLY